MRILHAANKLVSFRIVFFLSVKLYIMMKFVSVFHKGNLTISGNFAATSERLLQLSCIVAVR